MLGCRGPCPPSGVLCDSVGWVPVCEGVQSAVQGPRFPLPRGEICIWCTLRGRGLSGVCTIGGIGGGGEAARGRAGVGVFVGVLGGYPGVGLSSRGGNGRSLRGVVGVRCSLGGAAWWPAVGWAWGSCTACLGPCTASPRVFSGGAVWPRVLGVAAAGDSGVGCLVARVRALWCVWCSGVLHACPRVHCRTCSGGTSV